jgi:protein-disulfide isomerase
MIGLAAMAIGAGVIHREFISPPIPNFGRKSEYVKGWKEFLPAGRLDGRPEAPITVIEFTDLECPFCRRFNQALHTARTKFPGQISVLTIHFPIPAHKYAETAAHAVECGAEAGRSFETRDFIFESQDSLGRKPWVWFAQGAGVQDTARFSRCMSDSTQRRLVTAGVAAGKRIGVIGTPTIILNGWRYGSPPADTEFVRAIADLLAHRKPYRGYPEKALGTRLR